VELARAQGAARREVDALLRGLSVPLPAGEDARARADLLHDILEDKRVRAFTGSNGRRVAHAAVEALEALGYPYALEVPPELLAEARAALPPPHEEPAVVEPAAPVRTVSGRTGAQIFGGGLIAVPVMLVGGLSLLSIASGGMQGGTFVMVLCYALISVTAAVLAPTESVRRMRWLHWLLVVMAALPGVAALGIGLKIAPSLRKDAFWFMLLAAPPLGLGLMQLVGATLLAGRHPDDEGGWEQGS
jgi:hypothetical protein